MSQILKNTTPNSLSLSAITPLDFDTPFSKIPSTHLWPAKDVNNHPSESISVPIIDLSGPKQEQLDQIKHACEEWGFFQIINHGVAQRILDDFKREAMTLFSLPMEVKMRALRNPEETSGYGGLPISKFSPSKMWHEGFGIKKELHEHGRKLWPPHGNPNFCQVMEEYQQEMKTLAEKILTLMLGSLGLTPDDTNWAESRTEESPYGPHGAHLQLNSYPTCPDPDQAMGMTQHTDTSILTLLNQVNEASGLQILHKDKWVNVKPTPGSFVVNNGDLAHFISNGRFVSAVHRVVPNRAEHRYSAAYFYGPPFEALLAPLPKLVGPGQVPMYRSFTWKDYVNAKYKYADKVFEIVRTKTAESDDCSIL